MEVNQLSFILFAHPFQYVFRDYIVIFAVFFSYFRKVKRNQKTNRNVQISVESV